MILFIIFKYHELIDCFFDNYGRILKEMYQLEKKPTREIVISAPTTI